MHSVLFQFILISMAVSMALIAGDPLSDEKPVVQAQPGPPFIAPSSGVLPKGPCSYGHFHCEDPKGNDDHWGIDIWTQASGEGLSQDSCGNLTKGNPVYAAYDGTIVGLRDVYSRASSHEKFDGVLAMIIIEHRIDRSYEAIVPHLHVHTLYTHMASQTCKESFIDNSLIDRVLHGNTHVRKGELLGYQGNRVMEGYAPKTHLHFQINVVDPKKEGCGSYTDPTPYLGVDCTACPQSFHAEPDSEMSPSADDSTVINSPDFKTLQSGQPDEIVFDVQNTGNTTWTFQQGYALINTNDESLGALPIQTLTSEVPHGQVIRWVIPITAPSQVGFYWTRWQMARGEEPFGSVVSCLVTVVPEKEEIGIDLGSLLEEWLNSLVEQIITELNEFWENLQRQIEEWFQRELERLWREFWESLFRQCCGAGAIAPAALLVSVWSINRKWHRRTRDRDRD